LHGHGALPDGRAILDRCRENLLPMAERDCRSFDHVSTAYAMPKDTDANKAARSRAIQEALVGAMVVPEQTLGMVRDVFGVIQKVIDCVGKTIASDLAAGASLLLAAGEGAFLNVQINAASLDDKDLAGKTMERATAVRDDVRRQQAAIARRVDEMLA
jgi:methenyltetrahydrofolate cyclohydrolase